MIAQDEIAVGGNCHFGIGAGVGVFVGDVVFVEGFVVDEDLAVFDADAVSGAVRNSPWIWPGPVIWRRI